MPACINVVCAKKSNGCIVVALIKGIVSPDWKGLQMVSLERFEV
jgi:hypothetical protein